MKRENPPVAKGKITNEEMGRISRFDGHWFRQEHPDFHGKKCAGQGVRFCFRHEPYAADKLVIFMAEEPPCFGAFLASGARKPLRIRLDKGEKL